MAIDGGVCRERNELIVDVHISRILKLSHNARSLFIQHSQIKRHSLVEQRRCRVALHYFAHGFIVKLAIDIDHISTLTRVHRIVQMHTSIVHRRIHRNSCLQITFRAKRRSQRRLRIAHQRRIVDHRGFSHTVHQTIDKPFLVCS